MTYALGAKSQANLAGVHPTMVALVTRAIRISTQDFTVFEGCRTLDRQKKLVAAGASKTLNSMHIPKPDVYGKAGVVGHAVDLVPIIDGQPRWEWGAIYPIAAAMAEAAKELGVVDKLCWGAVWDKWINAYSAGANNADEMKRAVMAYQVRHPGPDFIDGPHFQIGRLG